MPVVNVMPRVVGLSILVSSAGSSVPRQQIWTFHDSRRRNVSGSGAALFIDCSEVAAGRFRWPLDPHRLTKAPVAAGMKHCSPVYIFVCFHVACAVIVPVRCSSR